MGSEGCAGAMASVANETGFDGKISLSGAALEALENGALIWRAADETAIPISYYIHCMMLFLSA